jgi:hypothetical protein
MRIERGKWEVGGNGRKGRSARAPRAEGSLAVGGPVNNDEPGFNNELMATNNNCHVTAIIRFS